MAKAKFSNEQLRAAAEEMIDVMSLEDEVLKKGKMVKVPITIAEDASDADIITILKNAIKIINPDIDSFSEETSEIIDFLSEQEGQEDSPENGNQDLLDDIEDAEKLADLKDIVKENDIFEDLVDQLPDFKKKEQLKEAMIAVLNSEPEEEVEEEPVKETKKSSKKASEKEAPKVEKIPANAKKPVDVPKKEARESFGIEMVKVADLKTEAPFNTLFDIDKKILSAITADMKKNGFDPAFPVIAWDSKGIIVDGNTRFTAAKAAGIEEIPVEMKEFIDEDAALEYAINNQRNRRNLSDAELLRCIEIIDKKAAKGENLKKAPRNEKGQAKPVNTKTDLLDKSESRKETAKAVGVGTSKVSQARKVLADKEEKEAVESGKKTIAKAAKDIKAKEDAAKPKATKEPKLDTVQVCVDTLKDFAGKKVEIGAMISEAFETLMDANGKTTNAKTVENEMKNVIAVLVAFEWITIIDEKWIKIGKI